MTAYRTPYRKHVSRTSAVRRSYRFKKRVLLAILTVIIVITGILVGSNHLTASKTRAACEYQENLCYKSVEIKEGDTLWTIADEYMCEAFHDKDDYIAEIRAINHLNDDIIHTGAYLTVPYYEVEE